MRTKILVSLALVAITLAACNTEAPANQGAWTQAELNNVFDLSELGEATYSKDGSLLVGGKEIPEGLAETMPHLTYGKEYNLLKFSDEALNAMSPEAAHAVIYATPEEAREVMSSFGIGMDKLEAAWANDQEISVNEIYTTVRSLDSGLRAQGTSDSQGQELLSFLGLKGDE